MILDIVIVVYRFQKGEKKKVVSEKDRTKTLSTVILLSRIEVKVLLTAV